MVRPFRRRDGAGLPTDDREWHEDDHALSRLALGYAAGRGPGCEVADTGEEDDHSGQADEDGIDTAYHLVCYTEGASGPGCTISDPGGCQHDGREIDDGQ